MTLYEWKRLAALVGHCERARETEVVRVEETWLAMMGQGKTSVFPEAETTAFYTGTVPRRQAATSFCTAREFVHCKMQQNRASQIFLHRDIIYGSVCRRARKQGLVMRECSSCQNHRHGTLECK